MSIPSVDWSLQRSREALLDPSRPVWRDASLVVFDLDVEPATARAWLPTALRPADPARATIFVADYPDTSFGVAYRECGVLLHARLRGREVLHCTWMVVDDDSALILGRELLGFPKKLARIELEVGNDRVRARVERRGVSLLKIDGRLGETLAGGRAFAQPIVNVRGIPGPAPSVLLRMEVPERFQAGLAADLEISVGESPHDPIAALAAGGRAEGRWLRVDLGVPPANPAVIPRGIEPVGIVSPLWLLRAYPFRTL